VQPQSPINLEYRKRESAYNNRTYKVSDDGIQVEFTDLEDVNLKWKGGYTTNMAFYEDSDTIETQSYFSKLARDVFDAGEGFEAVALHFHAGSEHTIDNQRFDLEMHIVMKNKKIRQ